MAAVDIESVIKRGVEQALNEPIMNGKSVLEWAEIGIHSQVVRCKDCKHYKTHNCPCESSGDPFIDWTPDENWFCADGEVKQND